MKAGLIDGSPREIGNIYCIGRNYAKHAEELGNAIPEKPLVFLKASSALRGLNEQHLLAFSEETFHYEAELVLLIGRDVARETAPNTSDIEAIGLGIDLTRRAEQNRIKKDGHPWTLAKSFVGSALVGDLLPLGSLLLNDETLTSLEFSFALNGQEKQQGKVSDMITRPVDLLRYIHSFSTLQKGDLIFTGTPEGVGPIVRNDKFSMALKQRGRTLGKWSGVL